MSRASSRRESPARARPTTETALRTSLYGQGGSDTLDGEGGYDNLDGGIHDDSIRGGSENDMMFGGDGNDTLDGQSGADVYHTSGDSASFVDTLFVEPGTDTYTDRDANDQVF